MNSHNDFVIRVYDCRLCKRIIKLKECKLCWNTNKKGTRGGELNSRRKCQEMNIGYIEGLIMNVATEISGVIPEDLPDQL